MSVPLRLSNPQAGVPGGANFFVHQTNFTAHGATLSTLISNVKKHYNSNGIAVPENLKEVIEDQICRRLIERGLSSGKCVDSAKVKIEKRPAGKKKCCGG